MRVGLLSVRPLGKFLPICGQAKIASCASELTHASNLSRFSDVWIGTSCACSRDRTSSTLSLAMAVVVLCAKLSRKSANTIHATTNDRGEEEFVGMGLNANPMVSFVQARRTPQRLG